MPQTAPSGMSVQYGLGVKMEGEARPGPIPPWRFMLMTLIFVGVYLVGRVVVTPPQTHPALLLASIPLGALGGILVAKWEGTRTRRPQQGHRRPASEARWYLYGLAGTGLALGLVLPPASLEWMVLGMTALTTGAASHAWLTARRTRALRSV